MPFLALLPYDTDNCRLAALFLALLPHDADNRRSTTLSPAPLLSDSDKFYRDRFQQVRYTK
jgi:hypothetical protein